MKPTSKPPKIRVPKTPLAHRSAPQGVSDEDKAAATERAIDLLMPASVPFTCRDRIADEEFDSNWIVPRGYPVTTRDDVKAIVLKITKRLSDLTALDAESETHKAARAKLTEVADRCAALAEALDALGYEDYFLMHAHGRLKQHPHFGQLHELYEKVKDRIEFAGSPNRHPAAHACKLSEDLSEQSQYLKRLSEYVNLRASMIGGSRGSTTIARQFISSPQRLLINDCWSVWRAFGKPKPTATIGSQFHELIQSIWQGALGRVDTGFDNLLKKYVPLRRLLDELSDRLDAYARRLAVAVSPAFGSLPDMRDRASELVRAKRYLGHTAVSEIQRMLGEYFELRGRIEKGELVVTLDRAAGVKPTREIRSRSARKEKRKTVPNPSA